VSCTFLLLLFSEEKVSWDDSAVSMAVIMALYSSCEMNSFSGSFSGFQSICEMKTLGGKNYWVQFLCEYSMLENWLWIHLAFNKDKCHNRFYFFHWCKVLSLNFQSNQILFLKKFLHVPLLSFVLTFFITEFFFFLFFF